MDNKIHIDSLAETTALLESTTSKLTGSEKSITPLTGIELIDEWIKPLSENQNTQSISKHLQILKAQLQESAGADVVTGQMEQIAEEVSKIAADVGAEGEMPSLLTGLSAALRLGGCQLDKG